MPSVAEELAQLRKNGLTKKYGASLKDVGGLSTPEREAAALKEKAEKDKLVNYKKEATQVLQKGTKDLGLEHDFNVKQIIQKKDQQAKLNEEKNRRSLGKLSKVAEEKKIEEKGPADAKATPVSKPVKTEENISDAKAPAVSASDNKLRETAVEQKVETSKNETASNLQNSAGDNKMTEKITVQEESSTAQQTATIVQEENKDENSRPEPANDDADIPELEVSDDEAASENIPVMEDTSSLKESPDTELVSAFPPRPYQNRAEKKSRKMMQRLKMTPVPGITRVTLKMAGENQGYYTIDSPDVFEKNGSYLIFGEARSGSTLQREAAMQQARAAQQFSTPGAAPETGVAEDGVEVPLITPIEEELDEAGVESKDVDLVMSQGNCSRAEAVKALKENDGDLVNAIMSLTA